PRYFSTSSLVTKPIYFSPDFFLAVRRFVFSVSTFFRSTSGFFPSNGSMAPILIKCAASGTCSPATISPASINFEPIPGKIAASTLYFISHHLQQKRRGLTPPSYLLTFYSTA